MTPFDQMPSVLLFLDVVFVQVKVQENKTKHEQRPRPRTATQRASDQMVSFNHLFTNQRTMAGNK
jgi:hypothetical protein